MKLLFKILTVIFCLVAATAILAACFDETLDVGGAIDAGVADSVSPSDTVPAGGGSGSGGGSPVTPNPFIKDEYTVKTGVTATEDSLFVLHSCYNENGRLVADVYKNVFLAQYESDLYLTYDYDKNGYLEGWMFYDYRLEEIVRVELTLGENGAVQSSTVYEEGKKCDGLYANVEYHENGTLKKWEVKDGSYTEWGVEYDEAGNRVRESVGDADFIPQYGNGNYPTSAEYLGLTINIGYEETANGWLPCSLSFTDGDMDSGEYVITYDSRRNITSVTVLITGVDGNVSAEPEAFARMEAAYNSSDRVTKITSSYRSDDQLIPEEEYVLTYTSLGQVASEGRIGYNDDGTVYSKATYAYVYGVGGKVTQTTYTSYYYNDDGSYYKEVSVRKYDADGNMTSETNESGRYDKNGNPIKNEGVTETDRDEAGTTVVVRPGEDSNVPGGDNVPEGALTPSYTETDSSGNVVKAVFEYKEGDVDVKRTNEYDSNGNLIKVTSEQCMYDDNGNKHYIMIDVFDGDWNLLSSTDVFYRDGSETPYEIYVHEYDSNGNNLKSTYTYYLDDGSVDYIRAYENEYDENGNRTKEICKEYDGEGNLTYSDYSTIAYENYVDADGNSVTVQTRLCYTENGDLSYRTVSEFITNTDGNLIKETFKGYWADGTQYIFREYLYAMFAMTKETCIWYNNDGTISQHYVYEYEYDEYGNETGGTYTEYDADGNVIVQRPLDENEEYV